jgi:bacillithiol system protein YtxJ
MSLRERMVELHTPEEVDQFLNENPVAAVFKAGTCHKTMQGWGNVERLLRDRDEVRVGIIRVVEHRPASNRVAEVSGVTHESPQVILFREGQPRFDLDNWDITVDNLGAMLDTHLPASGEGGSGQAARSNLAPYKQLLDSYLGGQLPERQFQFAYLETFRGDASLRSQEEFDVLNSLFGNPDEHHIHPGAIISLEPQQTIPLQERARRVRQELESL